jgi:hypothetical protein
MRERFDAGKRSATGTRELRAAKSLSFIPAGLTVGRPSEAAAALPCYSSQAVVIRAAANAAGGSGASSLRWVVALVCCSRLR